MDRVPNMGMRRDMAQRISLARVDNIQYRNRVEAAREAVYTSNLGVDSTAVETLLKEHSLVPTTVSVLSLFSLELMVFILQRFRVHFQES